MQFAGTFYKLRDAYRQHPRYIDSEGGTRSAKTYSNLQLLILLAMSDKTPTITSIVSETFPHLKRGVIRDMRAIMEEDKLWNESCWNRSDNIYRFPTGSIIEFFSADNAGKVHGSARDRLFINEAQNISYEIARQLFVRTKGFIICDYNPTHQFWMHEQIAPRENCISIHSTYKDNPFLSRIQIEEIESNRKDANWWRVYGEGKVGMLDGLIYDFESVDSIPSVEDNHNLVEVYGMDFGFAQDPTALIRIVADPRKKEAYLQELCYETHMLNRHIIERLHALGVRQQSVIYADCAEPKSIAEIKEAGFNIRPSDKDAPVRSEKLKFQLQWMQGWRLFVTKESINLIKELRNYTWEKDGDGNNTNTPIDKWNHALDAARYGLYSRFGKEANYGNYNVRFL